MLQLLRDAVELRLDRREPTKPVVLDGSSGTAGLGDDDNWLARH